MDIYLIDMLECSGWFLTDGFLYIQVALLLLHHPGVAEVRSLGTWAENQKVLASSPGLRQKLEGVLLAEEGARTSSEHCHCTLEQF